MFNYSDAAAIEHESTLVIKMEKKSEFLLFDLAQEMNQYGSQNIQWSCPA